ncbi:MAG: penicillin-binding protein activator LpoB [Kangiellaceae bacterium]|jgi:uncharacterized protein (TIGR02722 family)|nr:penicillin-binding protein activator LpoB [Kangiellaceae bacterium]
MKLKLAIIAAVTLSISACGGSNVQYGDATAIETTTVDFGSTDLQSIAEKMVGDMLVFPPIAQTTSQRRPILFVDNIRNKTTEHIDTESITDTIQSKLINSGRFRFVDMTAMRAAKDQLDYQNKSGMVDQNRAMSIGKQYGAEYMLYGNLSSIVKRSSSTKDVYYKFTLKLMHLESGILEWSGEKEIRKTREKSLFGV